MRFNEELLELAEDNPVKAIIQICAQTKKYIASQNTGEWTESDYDLLLESIALVTTIIEAKQLQVKLTAPKISVNIQDTCGKIFGYLSEIEGEFTAFTNEMKLEMYKEKYRLSLGVKFSYEFSQGDLERIQILVNELRTNISACNDLTPEHKQRLLKRLEKLQSELHKKVSDLDRFWGMVGDAGVILGKLGTDAKPIVDRVREISEIVWRTQARTEELPSNMSNPMLEHENT